MKYKYHGLELTSKVNLSEANGKGAIELDWSTYDISNKYFVVYRKQENEEWKTIVNLENKFNDNKYIDNLGNDKNSPEILNINIKANQENNSINTNINVQDKGSMYTYYIESYDINSNILLSKSNEIKIT